ncbi:Hypothetical predicted protein [Paramuricea clavata]|uniref:Uncharacterized protein n=1 Tax=Paramuricea clavata TaxID=317549 RepID=A0A6S7FJN6_PARCT|nr:Hypothetical predicted protein [Paramuricea clavata]
MEKKQKEAERSRRNRRKRKSEFEKYKEFYKYATENNMSFVQEFEAKRQASSAARGNSHRTSGRRETTGDE